MYPLIVTDEDLSRVMLETPRGRRYISRSQLTRTPIEFNEKRVISATFLNFSRSLFLIRR